jgi:hypothetical protein
MPQFWDDMLGKVQVCFSPDSQEEGAREKTLALFNFLAS